MHDRTLGVLRVRIAVDNQAGEFLAQITKLADASVDEAQLSFLLPHALLAAGALLAVAFWWAYRPAVVCAAGTCNPISRGPLRWIVWAAAVLVVGLATVALGSG